MRRSGLHLTIALGSLISLSSSNAAPPPLEAFFEGAQIRSAAISPDGRALAMIAVAGGKTFVAVKDRTSAAPAVPVLAAPEKESFEPRWCRWANNERLLCSFIGRERHKERGKIFPLTRLAAVNADGTQQKVLVQNVFAASGQIHDRIIDWTPDDPKTVLIELWNPRGGLRVFELDVYDGGMKLYEGAHEYVGSFGTDGQGAVRLGWGTYDLTTYYYARLAGEKKWRRLARVNVLSTDEAFTPIAVVPGTNYAYATRDHEGRSALWKIDLADQEDPQLIFASSKVDVMPVYAPNNRLLGVLPDSGSKDAFYLEPSAALLGEVLARLFEDRLYRIQDMTQDLKTLVIATESDIKATEFYVLDMSSDQRKLQRLGSRLPGLQNYELASTQTLSYPARDGTLIPGFLTKPVGAGADPTPLIIMPHGGPWSRDRWGFDSWVQMLAGQGYTVLQMNFRGSAGYGKVWREASMKDWGGLPYTDVIDGLRWALEQKHGDPARVCVLGASFGGYLALSAAVRDSQLLKCVVSIAGVSDLRELKSDAGFFSNRKVVREIIGTDSDKLKADSPRLQADRVNVPVLLVHGTEDYTVEPDQTELMADALQAAGKQFQKVMIEGTDHYFMNQAHQKLLFTSITDFLKKHLGATAPAGAATEIGTQ